MALRVLIVDDEELVRAGPRLILEPEPDIDVIGEASDGRAGVDAARTLRPDVVLMDIQTKLMDGLEATRRILAATADVKVVIVTTLDHDEHVYEVAVIVVERRTGTGSAPSRSIKRDTDPARGPRDNAVTTGEAATPPGLGRGGIAPVCFRRSAARNGIGGNKAEQASRGVLPLRRGHHDPRLTSRRSWRTATPRSHVSPRGGRLGHPTDVVFPATRPRVEPGTRCRGVTTFTTASTLRTRRSCSDVARSPDQNRGQAEVGQACCTGGSEPSDDRLCPCLFHDPETP